MNSEPRFHDWPAQAGRGFLRGSRAVAGDTTQSREKQEEASWFLLVPSLQSSASVSHWLNLASNQQVGNQKYSSLQSRAEQEGPGEDLRRDRRMTSMGLQMDTL